MFPVCRLMGPRRWSRKPTTASSEVRQARSPLPCLHTTTSLFVSPQRSTYPHSSHLASYQTPQKHHSYISLYWARSPVRLSQLQGEVLTTRNWPLLLAGELKFACHHVTSHKMSRKYFSLKREAWAVGSVAFTGGEVQRRKGLWQETAATTTTT